MKKREYEHTPYWYATHYGWTVEDTRPFFERGRIEDIFPFENTPRFLKYNLMSMGLYLMAIIGSYAYHELKKIADPKERERIKNSLMRDLRILRRPRYYALETEKRRKLAAERRKIRRRTTTAPMPTVEQLKEAWARRKDSKENMIRLGGLLQDLECYVDNSLKFDRGVIVGRQGGIHGWLRQYCPELAPKYKTLMRYKAMVVKLRQLTETRDPVPTEKLLGPSMPETVAKLIHDPRDTFHYLETAVGIMLDPAAVLDATKIAWLANPPEGRRSHPQPHRV